MSSWVPSEYLITQFSMGYGEMQIIICMRVANYYTVVCSSEGEPHREGIFLLPLQGCCSVLNCSATEQQSCPILCDPIDCSTPGFPVLLKSGFSLHKQSFQSRHHLPPLLRESVLSSPSLHFSTLKAFPSFTSSQYSAPNLPHAKSKDEQPPGKCSV